MPSGLGSPTPRSLFSDRPRIPSRALPYSTSAYERLDRTDGEAAGKVRETIDRWWLNLPAAARPQVRERFMNPAPAVHLGGFFEIYVHEVLRQVCSEVVVDIGNDDETGQRRPDLRAVSAERAFGVEVTAVLGDDSVDPRDRSRVNHFYDVLNSQLRNRDFLLDVKVRIPGPQMPGAKLAAEIDRWLDPIDPDVELERQAAGNSPRKYRVKHRGWVVDLVASPLKPDLRGRPDFRVIGNRMEGFEVASVDNDDLDTLKAMDDIGPLLRSLKKKAGHGYELREEPFVIAALCGGVFVEDIDIEMALMGGPGDGLWVSRGRPRYGRVSAVLTVTELTPGSSALVEPCLWINPWAKRPLAVDQLPWRRIEFQGDGSRVEIPASRTTAEILGLGPRWPHG
jgi:hypothetical protein